MANYIATTMIKCNGKILKAGEAMPAKGFAKAAERDALVKSGALRVEETLKDLQEVTVEDAEDPAPEDETSTESN